MSSFDKILEHNILYVLGMNDTTFGFLEAQKPRLAVGHLNGQELPTWNMSSPLAPGGAPFIQLPVICYSSCQPIWD